MNAFSAIKIFTGFPGWLTRACGCACDRYQAGIVARYSVAADRDIGCLGYEDALELRVHDGKTLYDDLAQPGAADQFFRRRQIIHPVDIDADAIADGARVAPARGASARVDQRVRRIGPDLRLGTVGPKRLVASALPPDKLPPIDLVGDVVDIRQLAADHPAAAYLLPCRGSGVQVAGELAFLDTRPAERLDWLMVGCERSLQFHRHFYGDEPPRVDICPRLTRDLSTPCFDGTVQRGKFLLQFRDGFLPLHPMTV